MLKVVLISEESVAQFLKCGVHGAVHGLADVLDLPGVDAQRRSQRPTATRELTQDDGAGLVLAATDVSNGFCSHARTGREKWYMVFRL